MCRNKSEQELDNEGQRTFTKKEDCNLVMWHCRTNGGSTVLGGFLRFSRAPGWPKTKRRGLTKRLKKSTKTGIIYYGENANQKRYATVRQLQPDFVIVQIETDIEWLAFSGIGNKQRNCTTFSSRNGARTSRPWSDITRSSRPRLRKEIRSSSIWISSINPGQDLSLHHNIQLAINRPIWHSQL